MNPVMESLLTRRSCRAFTAQPISAEHLQDILKAAAYAPSGMGRQTWQFTAITDQEKLKKLYHAVEEVTGREGYNMYQPAAVILTSNEKDSPFAKEDNACALENIFLAAHSYGIGSVWINQLKDICDEPVVRAELTALGVPADHGIFGVAALGYPAAPLPTSVEKKGVIRIVE